MIDRYNRKINYLRISITDKCNLRCKYCMPEDVKYLDMNEVLSTEEINTIIDILTELGIDKIRITGGEPFVRPDFLEILNIIGSKNIKQFGITTNGLLLKKYAPALQKANVNRINISLDSLNCHTYEKITGSDRFHTVLEGINHVYDLDFAKIKINTVLMKDINDKEILDFINLTKDRNIDVRFIELMPIGNEIGFQKENYLPLEHILDICSELRETEDQEPSSPSKHYTLPNAKGRVGLIRPLSSKFCKDCNRIRLTASGNLKLCLHHNDEINIKEIIKNNSKEDAKKIILDAINLKPKEHYLEDNKYIDKSMHSIGG
ncbi:MAG: GTP 3',8-cyclase MoaA [Lachnospirales bacterium]